MASSMTAFARVEQTTRWGTLVWEIRSVNHRYLELQFRLPENLRDLEPVLREKLRKKLARGKVECGLIFRPNPEDNSNYQINEVLLAQLQDALQELQTQVHSAQAPNALDLLQWPGILESSEIEYEHLKIEACDAFDKALQQLATMRGSEGSALVTFIEQRLEQIAQISSQVRSNLPAIMTTMKERLNSRIEEAKVNLEPGRLEQEVVILLQKADVDEELDRLQTHIAEVTNTLHKTGAIGRRLDFLMQELNREANTLSSKAVDTDITQAAVELKVAIEQMREQIQNIE